jgi:hypothetical protein
MRWAGLLYYTGHTARGTLDGAVSYDADALAGEAGGPPPTLPGDISKHPILLVGSID